MYTWKTKNGSKIFKVLSGRSNVYLIMGGNNFILVDTGIISAFDKLNRNLESLSVPVTNISTLILTHTHYDHCQSAHRIKDESNCDVIVSAEAVKSIEDGYKKVPAGTFLLTKLIVRFGRLIGKGNLGFEPFQPLILVDEAYNLNIDGCKIQIIETAGHSSDSVSIIVDDEIAIVGDAMFGIFKNSVFPPFADDIEKMIKSWGKLLNTDCKIFLPGHGREIKRNLLEKEYVKYSPKFRNKVSFNQL